VIVAEYVEPTVAPVNEVGLNVIAGQETTIE